MDQGSVLRITDLLITSERQYACQLDTLLQVFWIPAMTLGVVDAEEMPNIFGKSFSMFYFKIILIEMNPNFIF